MCDRSQDTCDSVCGQHGMCARGMRHGFLVRPTETCTCAQPCHTNQVDTLIERQTVSGTTKSVARTSGTHGKPSSSTSSLGGRSHACMPQRVSCT